MLLLLLGGREEEEELDAEETKPHQSSLNLLSYMALIRIKYYSVNYIYSLRGYWHRHFWMLFHNSISVIRAPLLISWHLGISTEKSFNWQDCSEVSVQMYLKPYTTSAGVPTAR
jgi:hypothetical protein